MIARPPSQRPHAYRRYVGISLLLLLPAGCAAALEPPHPSPEVLVRAAQIEALAEPGYQTALAILGHFRDEIGRTPYPDSGGTDRASRQQTRYFFTHSLARAFLLGVEGDSQFGTYRREVAEFMLKAGWMTRARVDSTDLYYLGHAVAGFSPDVDRIVRTLDRLDAPSTLTLPIVREALLNLEAWEYLLSDEERRHSVLPPGSQLMSGESITVEEYLHRTADLRASLELYAGVR